MTAPPPSTQQLKLTAAAGAGDTAEFDAVSAGLMFPESLPIPDSDHGMHHVMGEMKEFFHDVAEPTRAISKFFGHHGRHLRFFACVHVRAVNAIALLRTGWLTH